MHLVTVVIFASVLNFNNGKDEVADLGNCNLFVVVVHFVIAPCKSTEK